MPSKRRPPKIRVRRATLHVQGGTPLQEAMNALWNIACEVAPKITGDGRGADERAWSRFAEARQQVEREWVRVRRSAASAGASVGEMRTRDAELDAFLRDLEHNVQDLQEVRFTALKGRWSQILHGFGILEEWLAAAEQQADGRLLQESDRWLPYDHERVTKYMGSDPAKYKGQLRKLAKRHPEIRRSATEKDRAQFGRPRLVYVYDIVRLFELIEGEPDRS